jgi:hypothetical protein
VAITVAHHAKKILTETLNALVLTEDTTPRSTLDVPILNGYLDAKS